MRNREAWRPSKAELHRGRWRASRNTAEVAMGSRLVVDLMLPILADMMREYAGGEILELGCGKVPYYAMYLANATRVTCVDWGSSVHSSVHVDIETDLGQPLPLPDASYDTVIATDLFEHVAYPETLWSEIARVIRPGGRVIVTVPFLYQLHEVPHDHHRYTIFRLRRFLVDHGFLALREEVAGGAAAVYIDISLRMLVRFLPKPLHDAFTRAAARGLPRAAIETAWPLEYLVAAKKGR